MKMLQSNPTLPAGRRGSRPSEAPAIPVAGWCLVDVGPEPNGNRGATRMIQSPRDLYNSRAKPFYPLHLSFSFSTLPRHHDTLPWVKLQITNARLSVLLLSARRPLTRNERGASGAYHLNIEYKFVADSHCTCNCNMAIS